MAGTAGDGIGRHASAQLREIFGVDVGSHPDHHAGFFFDGVRIRGEVVAFGLGVAGVTELAFDAEVSRVLTHLLNDLVSGDVFGESLDVGGIGPRAAGLIGPCRLSCRRSSGRLLRENDVG